MTGYARLFRQLRKQGTPIPTNDLWIAALAAQHDLLLFTRDAHFNHLPIALGILAAGEILNCTNLAQTAIVGELSLDGQVCPVRGILSMVLAARKEGVTRFIVFIRACLLENWARRLGLIPVP